MAGLRGLAGDLELAPWYSEDPALGVYSRKPSLHKRPARTARLTAPLILVSETKASGQLLRELMVMSAPLETKIENF